jgi:rRNA maturation protein Nop10
MAITTRYCEMCDTWTRKTTCAECGADTRPAAKETR